MSTSWRDGAAAWQVHFSISSGSKEATQVLDVGCGTGVITAALAERGCTAVGLDASEPYLEGARRDRSHPNIVYELGDARRMSYADPSFDACVSALAIDVIPEVDQVDVRAIGEEPFISLHEFTHDPNGIRHRFSGIRHRFLSAVSGDQSGGFARFATRLNPLTPLFRHRQNFLRVRPGAVRTPGGR
jgi:SAM-dependent methyltransferase